MQYDVETDLLEAGHAGAASGDTGSLAGRRWVERHEYVVEATSEAPVEVVYDVLADLNTHVEWSGRRLGDKAERLLSIDAPAGPARVGTVFRSTGYTPMGTFRDRSRVVAAERPARFEFVTESVLERTDGSEIASTWVHRFSIEPAQTGSRIVRRDRQARFYAPAPWWVRILAWQPINLLGYRMMGEPTARRTIENLARAAEERAEAVAVAGDPSAGAAHAQSAHGGG